MRNGLTRSASDGLRRATKRHVGDTRVPGLVALVAKGDELHVEALGNLAVGGPPAARDSIFRIASTTKLITAAATLAVVEEGLIELDEPVDRVLPELAGRPVLRRMDGPLDESGPAVRAISTRDLDRQPWNASAAGPARRALAVQHRCIGAGRAARPRHP